MINQSQQNDDAGYDMTVWFEVSTCVVYAVTLFCDITCAVNIVFQNVNAVNSVCVQTS